MKVLLGLVVVLLLNAAIAGYFYTQISQDLRTQVQTQVQATTTLHTNAYSNWFQNRNGELVTVQNSYDFSYRDNSSISELLLNEQIGSDSIDNFHYVSVRSGKIVASSNENAVGKSVLPWGFNRSMFRRQSFYLSGQYRTVGGNQAIALGRKMQYVDFVLIAEIYTEDAGPVLNQTVSNASTHVVTAGGSTLLGQFSGEQIPETTESSPVLERTESHIFAYQSIPSMDGLVVVTKTPKQAAFSLGQTVRQSFILTIVLTFSVLAVVTVTGSRSVVSDVSRLADRAQSLGEGELNRSLLTAREDEIGVLYESFDEMRGQLKARIEEAETLNHQLQVTDRLLRHNLHNDMNVIQMQAELIRDEITDTPTDEATVIVTKCESLLAKTDKQREITSTLSVDTERQSMDIVPMCQRIAEKTDMTYPDATVQLDTPQRATVLATAQFSKALIELLENAIVHNDHETPVVELTVRQHTDSVSIRIADNGPGLPEMDQQILDGQHEADQLSHGSGIGLWLVYWVVQKSGGTIRYEPNTPRGSAFIIGLDSR